MRRWQTSRVASDLQLAELGRAVRAERNARYLSQEELAERAGLHRNYIGGIERGERNVGVMALFRIAAALDLHPAKLLERCGQR
jgi:transcriptional regulator with XRE-family HTH domain